MTSATRKRLGALAGSLLSSIYQHRLLSTQQLHAMHAPDAGLRHLQMVLGDLHAAGLVAYVDGGWQRLRLHYVTRHGADACERSASLAEPRRYLLAEELAAGALQAHTLAVNDVGIAFMNAARDRGDDCGPYAWRHEIAHQTTTTHTQRGRPLLVADAVISYLQQLPDRELAFHHAFVELDRATAPTDTLATKLARYADLHHYAPKGATRPTWRAYYPAFPHVICVLAAKPRPTLERRAQTVLALCAANERLAATPNVRVSLCLLEDLVDQGPFAAILNRPDAPTSSVNWLGESA